jgi:hypothetical protein
MSVSRVMRTAGLAALAAAFALGGAFAPAHAALEPRAAMADSTAGDSAAAAAPLDGAHLDALLTRCLDRMAGVIPGSDTLVDWDTFRTHPQRTIELILPTLKPVRRGLSLGAPNMVWRVRVLQRLSGLAYTAPTRAKLKAEEARWLAPDSLRRVPFAGENAKLGMTYVAPADAQKAIIAHWRMWWASDAKKPELPMKRHDDDRTWWY